MSDKIGNIARVVLGLGTVGLSEATVFQPRDQRKAAARASESQRQAELEARRIAASKKPMEESATLRMNTEAGAVDPLTALNLVVEPTQQRRTSGLGAQVSGTGLGFNV